MKIPLVVLFLLFAINLSYALSAMAILEAARFGYGKDIKNLMELGTSLESQEGLEGKTPLTEAARLGELATMRNLILCGADVNACDGLNKTPLCMAATGTYNGRLAGAAVYVLLHAGAIPDTLFWQRAIRRTHVMEAIARYNKEIEEEKQLMQQQIAQELDLFTLRDIAGIVTEYAQKSKANKPEVIDVDPEDHWSSCYDNGCFPTCNCP